MSTQEPKAKYGRAGETGHSDEAGNSSEQTPSSEEKKKALDQGIPNNSNTQTGTAQSGYDEKNPKKPGGQQQINPKVTNQDNEITNSQDQNNPTEEPVDEQVTGNATEGTDPDIDSSLPDIETTEKKVPTMNAEL